MKTMSQMLLMGALFCLVLLPGLLDASSLMKLIKPQAPQVKGDLGEGEGEGEGVWISSSQAHGFLSRSRRNAGKWHRNVPDFQAYYRYYNSIGHNEGLYEIDRIRMLYQQMRHLEQVHGPNAPYYQHTLGLPPAKCDPQKDSGCKTPPPEARARPPSTALPPASQAGVQYLCDSRDPRCRPYVVYSASPFPCDPRFDPACAAPPKQERKPPPPAAPKPYKAMEYDCDPYWDPDCLRETPLMLTKGKTHPPPAPAPQVEEEEEEEAPARPPDPAPRKKGPYYTVHGRHYSYDPYDPYSYVYHQQPSQ
ncbi:actinodin3 [Polyodon spathula]|uniref:actinodin3 n=1 Tax=Polyodon spathula TaxID=7913 RepID=UPI001B7EF951|nr:actinodin3 [Polyodon spathula]